MINFADAGGWHVRLLSQSLLLFFESKVEGKDCGRVAHEIHEHRVHALQTQLIDEDYFHSVVGWTLSRFDLADSFGWIVIKEKRVVNKYLHDYRAVLGVNDFR